MKNSKVIEVHGVFVGAAIRLPGAQGWRLVAADPRLVSIDGATAASFGELQGMARKAFLASPMPAPRSACMESGARVA